MIGKNTLDSRISFTRNSSGSYFSENGKLIEIGPNEPRFNHNPLTGEYLGLLLERERTNLIESSTIINDRTGWVSWNDGYVYNNATRAPDGTYSGDKLYWIGDFNNGGRVYGIGTADTSIIRTVSCFVKAADFDQITMYLDHYGGTRDLQGNQFDLSSGTIISDGSSEANAKIESVGNGWYRISASGNDQNGDNTNVRMALATGAPNPLEGVYIWGAQMTEGSYVTSFINSKPAFDTRPSKAWYFNQDGNLTEAASGEARTDHYRFDGTKWVNAGLLIEAASENLILDSRDPSTGNWGTDGTLTQNQVGIDGQSNTAWTIQKAGASANDRSNQTVNLDSGSSYVASVYIKNLSIQGVTTLGIRDSAGDLNRIGINWDGNTITEFGDATDITPSIEGGLPSDNIRNYFYEPAGNGWYRVWVTIRPENSGSATYELDYDRDFNSSSTTGSLAVDQFQLEQADYPSSPMITTSTTFTRSHESVTSSPTTRNGEVTIIDNINWYNNNQGTFIGEINHSVFDGSYNPIFVLSDDGNLDNRVDVSKNSNTIRLTIEVNNTLVVDDFSGPDLSQNSKFGIGITRDNFSIIADGTTIHNDTSGSVPINMTRLELGYRAAGTHQFDGHIKSLRYIPKRLLDSTIEEITS